MTRYMKKPIIIEALVWTGKNQREMFDFLTESVDQRITLEESEFRIDLVNGGCQVGNLIIKTKYGETKADIGDYVIKESFPTYNRKYYPCKPDIFTLTYDKISMKEYPKDNNIYSVENDGQITGIVGNDKSAQDIKTVTTILKNGSLDELNNT